MIRNVLCIPNTLETSFVNIGKIKQTYRFDCNLFGYYQLISICEYQTFAVTFAMIYLHLTINHLPKKNIRIYL